VRSFSLRHHQSVFALPSSFVFNVDQAIPQCNSSETFVHAVFACISKDALNDPRVIETLVHSQPCDGGVFDSAISLERLRFCSIVHGDLIAEDIETDIDPTVFWNIKQITGS
jgi:hypothetical protein